MFEVAYTDTAHHRNETFGGPEAIQQLYVMAGLLHNMLSQRLTALCLLC